VNFFLNDNVHCNLHIIMVFMSDVTCGNLELWATWGSFLSSCDKYGATSSKLILWMFVQLASINVFK